MKHLKKVDKYRFFKDLSIKEKLALIDFDVIVDDYALGTMISCSYEV